MSILNFFDFKPKLKAYADELIKALAREGCKDWSFDSGQQALIDGSGSIMNLVNFHSQYVAARRVDRADVLARSVEMCLLLHTKAPRDWMSAAEGVRLVVRSRYDMSTVEVDFENERNDRTTAAWPLVGDLQLRLVYDFGPHINHVATEDLLAWGEPEALVRARGLENLTALMTAEWKPLTADVFQLDPNAEFAESGMLLTAVIDQLPFKESVAVVAPNRGILLAADASSDSALATMLEEAIRSLQNKPWPMSGTVCFRHDGEWQALEREGEIGRLLHVLKTLNMGGIYADQKTAIDSHYESIDRDVFVASFSVLERDGGLSSWSSWAEDCTSLLPETDIVVLGRNNGEAEPSEQLPVAWKDLERVAGSILQPTQFNPPRHFVDAFPDDAQWIELEKLRLAL